MILYSLSTCPDCLHLSQGSALKFSKHILFHHNLKNPFFNSYCLHSYPPRLQLLSWQELALLFLPAALSWLVSHGHYSMLVFLKPFSTGSWPALTHPACPPTTCCSSDDHPFTPPQGAVSFSPRMLFRGCPALFSSSVPTTLTLNVHLPPFQKIVPDFSQVEGITSSCKPSQNWPPDSFRTFQTFSLALYSLRGSRLHESNAYIWFP